MERPPLEIRDDLLEVSPYESPQLPARFRMNTNESPYPPPQPVLDAAIGALRALELNRYPEHDASELVNAVAGHAGWSPESTWLANGSNEVFLHLFLAFGGPGRRALTFEPSYSLHRLIPQMTGTEVVSAPPR